MKAVQLTGIRAMTLTDVPVPAIAEDDQVLVRMRVVGVCGSDVHYYTQGRIGSLVVDYPFAVGHECAGVVEAVGSNVSRVQAGDAVAIDPAMFCGACEQCRMGRPNTCLHLRFLGCPGQAEGCLSEYIVMPEQCCFRLQESTDPELGALSEPLAIGVYACTLARSLGGARIGILGCGPIGMSVLLSARHAMAGAVYVTDKIDARLQLATQGGATWTGNPDKADVVAEIAEREPGLLDYVFECCGKQEAIDQAIALLRPGGTLFLIGIPEVERISFSIDAMRRNEITFQNVRRQNGCTKKTLDLIESGDIDPRFLITHRFPMEETQNAFEMVADYRDGVMKAMITFPE